MPNGGTDNCMNCAHNRANQQPTDVKSVSSHTRIPYCSLRNVAVYDRAWTYCQNFTHRKTDDIEVKGPIYANGLWGPGYVRIPWYGLIEPMRLPIGSCLVCGEKSDEGISLISEEYKVREFCSNEHYEEWVKENPYRGNLSPQEEGIKEAVIRSDEASFSQAIDSISDISFTDDFGRTLLHWAVIQSNDEIFDTLLDRGIQIDITDRNRWTALHYAALFGNAAYVKKLISKNADVNLSDRIGSLSIDIAGSEGHSEIVSMLISASYTSEADRETALLIAAQQGNLTLVEALVKAGVEIDCRNKKGWTPLLKAIYEGHVTVSIYLLDQGADVNASNDIGYTPYSITHTWKTSGMEELRDIVIAHGGKAPS